MLAFCNLWLDSHSFWVGGRGIVVLAHSCTKYEIPAILSGYIGKNYDIDFLDTIYWHIEWRKKLRPQAWNFLYHHYDILTLRRSNSTATCHLKPRQNSGFPQHWISRSLNFVKISWPARSPVLTPNYFILWKVVKDHVDKERPDTNQDSKIALKTLLTLSMKAGTTAWRRVAQWKTIRMCNDQYDGHFQHFCELVRIWMMEEEIIIVMNKNCDKFIKFW